MQQEVRAALTILLNAEAASLERMRTCLVHSRKEGLLGLLMELINVQQHWEQHPPKLHIDPRVLWQLIGLWWSATRKSRSDLADMRMPDFTMSS